MNTKDLLELVKNDPSITTATLRAHLTIAGITDSKKQTALLAEAGIVRRTSGWTQTDTLNYLEQGVSESDLYDKLISEGAKNELRWINDRNRVRITLNKIYANFDNAVTEVPATKAQKADAKAIVAAK